MQVERVGSALVVSGSVSAQEDLALIERMAASVKGANRSCATWRRSHGPVRAAALPPPVSRRAPAAAPSPDRRGGMTCLPLRALEIEYDVQVIEASITFGSAPTRPASSRVAGCCTPRRCARRSAPTAQTFIPGKALDSKDIKIPPKELATSGIRLTLTPADLEEGS